MEIAGHITLLSVCQQILVGLSKTTILFIVASGLSLVLGVLRIPNVFHGSLYMIGAFLAFTFTKLLGGSAGAFFALQTIWMGGLGKAGLVPGLASQR